MMSGPSRITRSAALAVLGLPEHASPREITQAFRRLAKATHPDRTPTADVPTLAQAAPTDDAQRFTVLADAYHALAPTSEKTSSDPTTPPPPRVTGGPVSVPVRVRRPPGQPDEQPPIVAGPVCITPSPSPAPRPRRPT
jgi:hypothetical protein